jgi:hypothetical protein
VPEQRQFAEHRPGLDGADAVARAIADPHGDVDMALDEEEQLVGPAVLGDQRFARGKGMAAGALVEPLQHLLVEARQHLELVERHRPFVGRTAGLLEQPLLEILEGEVDVREVAPYRQVPRRNFRRAKALILHIDNSSAPKFWAS